MEDGLPERSSIDGHGGTAAVLVVDPDRRTRAERAGWLRDAGYAIREAASFEEARHLLAAAPPDVLVVRDRLGAFNGLHLIISARAARPALRAVLLTSADDPTLEAEARQAAAACLVKPILRDALLAAVAQQP